MAAAIAIESNTCPVHPRSLREICKPFAPPQDNTQGRCMLPSTEFAGVAFGTFGRAKTPSRTSSRRAGNDKQAYTWMEAQVWMMPT